MNSKTPKARKTQSRIAVDRLRGCAIDVDVNALGFDASRTDATVPQQQIFDPKKPLGLQKFVSRRIVATPGAIALLNERTVDMPLLIQHHLFGDWGDSDSDEIELNEFAVANDLRVWSTYRICDWHTQLGMSAEDRAELPTVWILTEFDRCLTTVILPSEY